VVKDPCSGFILIYMEAIMKINPEHKSLEAFVQFCIDDEVTEFNHGDLEKLSFALKSSPSKVREQLEGFGLSLATRAVLKSVRGFTANSHDRWFGKGSCPTHGGAGIDHSTGRATVTGKTV
jgi:hypothetical protein